MTRPDGHIVWYNRRWNEYTGTTPEAMEGWGWQAGPRPRRVAQGAGQLDGRHRRRESWEDTFPLRRHDGRMRWHLSRAVPLRDDDGRVAGWLGTNTDIEDRRRDVERMRAAKDQAEALRAKDDFLAVLSHELRTPLTPVLAAASAAGGPTGPGPRRAGGPRRHPPQRRARARLIDDLLALTDLLRGEARLHLEAVDAHASLLACLESCQDVIDSKRPGGHDGLGVRASARLGRPGTVAAGDLQPCGQRRQVHTRGRDHPPVLGVGRSAGGGGGRYRVGIDPEALPRIFDAFEQAGRTVRGAGRARAGPEPLPAAGGLHGTPEPPAGAGAGIVLHPRTGHDRRRPSAVRRLLSSQGRNGGGCPSSWSRTTRTRCVSSPGCWNDWATMSGPPGVGEALELADGGRFDLLVSDLSLPDGSGLEVMRAVKERHGLRHRHERVRAESDLQRSRDAGFEAHLTKPVDFLALKRRSNRLRLDAMGIPPSPGKGARPVPCYRSRTVREGDCSIVPGRTGYRQGLSWGSGRWEHLSPASRDYLRGSPRCPSPRAAARLGEGDPVARRTQPPWSEPGSRRIG